jgi:hypothetical protein
MADPFRPRDRDARSTPAVGRRRLLAATAPALLAGCLVESNEGPADGTEVAAGDGDADAGGPETESAAESASDSLSNSDETVAQTDEELVGESAGPDGSGLVVTATEISEVTTDGFETTVRARFTVENRGRFTYGFVLFRVDAYATQPSSTEREAVGETYVRQRYTSEDRFAEGTEQFVADVTFRNSQRSARAHPDWYEVDAAVRRAEPV